MHKVCLYESIITSDLVHIIPTLDSCACSASLKTYETLSFVAALPISQTANISSHLSMYRSVIFFRAELRSRSPMKRIVSKYSLVESGTEEI